MIKAHFYYSTCNLSDGCKLSFLKSTERPGDVINYPGDLGHFMSNTFSANFPTSLTGSLGERKQKWQMFFKAVTRKMVIKHTGRSFYEVLSLRAKTFGTQGLRID